MAKEENLFEEKAKEEIEGVIYSISAFNGVNISYLE